MLTVEAKLKNIDKCERIECNAIKEVAYELYKQNWIDTHTTREQRLDDIRDWGETKINNDEDAPCSYAESIDEFGYGGELYACFDEFLENEYLDKEFMTRLLDSQTLVAAYNRDTNVTEEILSVVDDALTRYPADNIEVNENGEDGKLYVIYTSRNNSFAISETGYDPDYVDMNTLTEELDKNKN